ncbi:metalloregulator ArsR/SmtB family transcription factor [Kribbella sandramycini]|uniref:Metalloregulator ArsR/SmtB family transcription factor n=1 Tax=Kribbella sandramycini TaxID=60450 RepID=A0A7Y4NYS6_9ACTN|nr:metalloregulator ArsR/SmtB family transcription factor [Kribbella sandramycini]MBB6568177.1 uncharacterized protein YndB with AHSA1/START domain/DNA-binding transcriptional ArsR family regulator [Kribbella sandramycini]NOL39229.1 metalloregulator ArsR/SmtB family transcription factor [Kribbella sandramycini]
MEQIAAVLGDGTRWRIVELLAERPRSVGELAELVGMRQPQATKHLQTLARAGLVTVVPLGQRRVYALDVEPLRALELRVRELIATAEAHAGDRDVISRYQAAIAAESARADRDRWADGRTFAFERVLPVEPAVVWRHWVEPALLAEWWAPPSLRVTDAVLEPHAGGRAVLEYADAEGRYRAEGVVHAASESERLVFDLALLDAPAVVSFRTTYDLTLTAVPEGTRLQLDLRITDSTVEAVPAIAGIPTGWNQVLDNLAHQVQGAQS